MFFKVKFLLFFFWVSTLGGLNELFIHFLNI